VRQLHLNAFIRDVGQHESAWRLPETAARAITDLDHYRTVARIAEAGAFDSVLFAHAPALTGNPRHRPVGGLEPTILLTALAAATRHIGLIVTAAAAYCTPYDLARRLASVDHVSAGRAGWNIALQAGDRWSRSFGLADGSLHRHRHARAAELLDVMTKLWDSWEDGAAVEDKHAGVFADADRIHPVRHAGHYYRVEGAL
jgi:alkanesulfonate monooxygenase SsuD/methylene tetrahydromethanopterin reductase-like flavin-dependent oxidoreductase (luciferase family)